MSKKNAYVCSALHITVTDHHDEGTTTMFIPCPICAKAGRTNRANSQMYMVDADIPATYEWYRPSEALLTRLTENMEKFEKEAFKEHVQKGGLLLRPKS